MSDDTRKLKKKVVSLVSNHYLPDTDEEITESENEEEVEGDEDNRESSGEECNQNEEMISKSEQGESNQEYRTELQAEQNENSRQSIKSPRNEDVSVDGSGAQTVVEEIASEIIDSSKLTYEYGFLPGCENIKLPGEPKAQCSRQLQVSLQHCSKLEYEKILINLYIGKDKIIKVRDRMQRFNYNINDDIQTKKHFKNPSIYEKLIQHYDLDEHGSNFDTYMYDLKSNGYLFYEELDEMQRNEWAKKEKEKKERVNK